MASRLSRLNLGQTGIALWLLRRRLDVRQRLRLVGDSQPFDALNIQQIDPGIFIVGLNFDEPCQKQPNANVNKLFYSHLPDKFELKSSYVLGNRMIFHIK